MNPPALALLQAVLDRIVEPARHTTGVYARDTRGAPVQPCSPRAVCWCLLGALLKEAPDETLARQDVKAALFASSRALLGEDAAPDDVNDLGHPEALTLLHDAASRLGGALRPAPGS